MKVQVVSYTERIPWEVQNDLNTELFNQSKADVILFPGWSFKDTNHVEKFNASITNKKTLGVFELKRLGSRKLTNGLFVVEKGRLRFVSFQLFTTAAEINNNPVLGNVFLTSFQKDKAFRVKGKSVRVLQCGELNILRNEQRSGNKVQFRFEDTAMKKEFTSILNGTDLILNPQHTPMGNQGKMSKRREYLSSSGRAYISTSNVPNKKILGTLKAAHYAYQNGTPLPQNEVDQGNWHVLYEYSLASR